MMATQQQVTTIDLLRHGDCEGGLIFRGHTDSALSQLGWQQMQQAIANHPQAGIEEHWQTIISSPLQRCKKFAANLADEIIVEPLLQEISFGDWDGQLTSALHQSQPEAVEAFWQNPADNTPPRGESLRDFQQRVVSAWRQILQQHRGHHNLLVTHGGVIRIILAHVLEMPLRPVSFLSVPHGCLSQIKIFHQDGADDWPQLIFHQPLKNEC